MQGRLPRSAFAGEARAGKSVPTRAPFRTIAEGRKLTDSCFTDHRGAETDIRCQETLGRFRPEETVALLHNSRFLEETQPPVRIALSRGALPSGCVVINHVLLTAYLKVDLVSRWR
jgi:hypothetical protein